MKRFSRILAVSTPFLFAASGVAGAELDPIYGPVYVAKKKEHHGDKEAKFLFTAPVPGSGKIVVKNGGDSGKKSRAASAQLDLNGNEIAKRKDFNKNISLIEYRGKPPLREQDGGRGQILQGMRDRDNGARREACSGASPASA